ncbi:MAG: Pyruvate kinase [candidate division WS2 bacterium]|nr:Pyruvate kinase [Candidatus Lithacetigena glycinireducens]MBT9175140.1 Pyruvate kinase [Candidatus Lithacetigena glycinireducens]
MTEKDLKDLEFAIKEDIDYVALSFVKSAKDIDDLRKELKNRGKNLPVIAKIEKHEALANLEEIIDRADAILIARGDLGVEISLEEVPLAQIKIIKKCRLKGKPVIVATQIMESMVNNPFPTRAEVNDIATAIIQGTDSIMFSSETAVGCYPVEVISTVNQVILKTEAEMEKQPIPSNYIFEKAEGDPLLALSYSACILADNLKAQAMIIPTETGKSAKRIARFRPSTRIIALTTEETISRQLCLVWGILPITMVPVSTIEEFYQKAEDLLLTKKLINAGDRVIFTSGAYIGLSGGTNTIKYHIVGDAH